MVDMIFGAASRQPKDRPVYLDWNDLYKKGIRYHRNYLRKMWLAGKFPRPHYLSPKKLVWFESEIDAWIAAQIEAAE